LEKAGFFFLFLTFQGGKKRRGEKVVLFRWSRCSTDTFPHTATHMTAHSHTNSYTYSREQRTNREPLRDGLSWEKKLSNGGR